MEEEEPTGYVRYERFLATTMDILADRQCQKVDEEYLYRAFLLKSLDTDRKGYLNPDELRNYMVSDGEPFTQEEVDEMLNVRGI
ncbi:Dynein regulatory complex protein 8 [Dinochytrium kinnereticum]|nr:Dynein regulatory complex protein 8 [Dinochytrium kinnereticum]